MGLSRDRPDADAQDGSLAGELVGNNSPLGVYKQVVRRTKRDEPTRLHSVPTTQGITAADQCGHMQEGTGINHPNELELFP